MPAGALPSGTTVSVYPITSPTTLVTSVPTGQTYLAAFSISWQAPDGTSPVSLSPVTVTVAVANLVVGATLVEVTPAGYVVVATVTPADVTAGLITFNIVDDPTFVLTTPVPLVPQAPLIVTSLSGAVRTPLTLAASGGSGTGAVTFTAVDGTATGCAVTGSSLIATSAGTCLVTATKAEDSAYLAVSSTVTGVVMAVPPKPSPVAVTFETKSHKLSAVAKASLTKLTRKLLAGAAVRVTGYASNDAILARNRAAVVKKYLLAKIKITVTVAAVTQSNTNNKVTVLTIRQTRVSTNDRA